MSTQYKANRKIPILNLMDSDQEDRIAIANTANNLNTIVSIPLKTCAFFFLLTFLGFYFVLTMTYFQESVFFLAEEKLKRIDRALNLTETRLTPAFNRSMDLAVRNYDEMLRKKTLTTCYSFSSSNFVDSEITDPRDQTIKQQILRMQKPLFSTSGGSKDVTSLKFVFFDGEIDKIANPRVVFQTATNMNISFKQLKVIPPGQKKIIQLGSRLYLTQNPGFGLMVTLDVPKTDSKQTLQYKLCLVVEGIAPLTPSPPKSS